MTKKLESLKGDLYSKAEEIYFAEGMDVQRALVKLTELILKDLSIHEDNAKKLGLTIMKKISKKFN
tara:strand:+ start:407 stop:604 length:198 start_codon:yes stop_codon:yes gene_type:complete